MLILPGLANLTVSSLTSLPSPAKPDFCECDKWYSNPWAPGHNILPTLVDCVDAWGELPKGSEFMLWHTKPAVGDPYGLPLIVSSGKYSTVETSTYYRLSASHTWRLVI